jgi:hypothetical protein
VLIASDGISSTSRLLLARRDRNASSQVPFTGQLASHVECRQSCARSLVNIMEDCPYILLKQHGHVSIWGALSPPLLGLPLKYSSVKNEGPPANVGGARSAQGRAQASMQGTTQGNKNVPGNWRTIAHRSSGTRSAQDRVQARAQRVSPKYTAGTRFLGRAISKEAARQKQFPRRGRHCRATSDSRRQCTCTNEASQSTCN